MDKPKSDHSWVRRTATIASVGGSNEFGDRCKICENIMLQYRTQFILDKTHPDGTAIRPCRGELAQQAVVDDEEARTHIGQGRPAGAVIRNQLPAGMGNRPRQT